MAPIDRLGVVAVESNGTLYIIRLNGSLIMRVSPLAAALLLAACAPPLPPGAAPAHAPRVLGALDEAHIYGAAVGYDGDSHTRRRAGLSRVRIKNVDLGEDGLLPDSVVSVERPEPKGANAGGGIPGGGGMGDMY